MVQHPHSAVNNAVPAELLEKHRTGWHFFTQSIVVGCISVAVVLLFLLLVFKVF